MCNAVIIKFGNNDENRVIFIILVFYFIIMNCPYCQSSSFVKNRKNPSQKPRWKCKNCKRTFSIDSGKGYPPTSVPFQFIAFMLYRYNGKGFARHVNLYMVKMLGMKPVDRTTVYSWVRKYGDIYMDLVSPDEANEWFLSQELLKLTKKRRVKKSDKVKKLLIERVEKLKGFHEDFLAWLIKLGFNRKDIYDIGKNNPEDFEKLKEKFKEILIQKNIKKISTESLAEQIQENVR